MPYARVERPNDFMSGAVGNMLRRANWDLSILRPIEPQTRAEKVALERAGRLSANALLSKDEWIFFDQQLVEVARETLVGIADLRSTPSLVRPLGGLGTLTVEWEKLSDMTAANIGMSPRTAGEKDTSTYTLTGVPVPVIWKDFEIEMRRSEASRRRGDSLDTTQIMTSTKLVAEKLEDVLFNGSSVKSDSRVIYGYTTHPDINTGSAAGDFGTISNIYPTISSMVTALEADHYNGPYILYVATTQYGEMRQIYTDGSPETAMSRVMRGFPQIRAIRRSERLAAGSLVMVQMTNDVVQLGLAEDVRVVQWSEYGGFTEQFKVMTAQVPIIKSDANGQSGICKFTGA